MNVYIYICIICIHIYIYIYIYIRIPKLQCTSELVNHLRVRAVTQMFCQFVSISEQEKGEFQVKLF